MRALWKGSISFGLVNIPVKMYVASKEKEFKFVMLHKKDFSKIRYARICKQEDKEVPWKDIVKGYEYKPDEYVVLDEGDFEKANLARTSTIEILDFVDESEVDSIYFVKPYYLEPDKNAEDSYALLRDALAKSKKVGIASFVLHNREHIAVIKPYENAIILNELHYEEEIIKPKDLKLPGKTAVANKQMSMALKLINQMTASFNPKKYKNNYSKELKSIIKQKAKGRKIKPKGEEKKPTKVHDIMSLLKASLNEPAHKKSRKAS